MSLNHQKHVIVRFFARIVEVHYPTRTVGEIVIIHHNKFLSVFIPYIIIALYKITVHHILLSVFVP